VGFALVCHALVCHALAVGGGTPREYRQIMGSACTWGWLLLVLRGRWKCAAAEDDAGDADADVLKFRLGACMLDCARVCWTVRVYAGLCSCAGLCARAGPYVVADCAHMLACARMLGRVRVADRAHVLGCARVPCTGEPHA